MLRWAEWIFLMRVTSTFRTFPIALIVRLAFQKSCIIFELQHSPTAEQSTESNMELVESWTSQSFHWISIDFTGHSIWSFWLKQYVFSEQFPKLNFWIHYEFCEWHDDMYKIAVPPKRVDSPNNIWKWDHSNSNSFRPNFNKISLHKYLLCDIIMNSYLEIIQMAITLFCQW